MSRPTAEDAGSAAGPRTTEQPQEDSGRRRSRTDPSIQSFNLTKYFSFSAFGVFLVFALSLSWIIANHARNVMLQQSEDYSLLLAENLNQQVFRRFVLPAVVRYGRIALRNPEQFDYLDRIVDGVVQGLAIDSVTIFDSSENVISYSTDTELVGIRDRGGIEYQKALEGEANSRFIYHGSIFSLFSGSDDIGCELITYIPFRQVKESGEEGEAIMGVIEITKDLTKDYTAILRLHGRIIIVSLLMMTVLFLVMYTIVSRAGRIIERRTGERLKLEEQLSKTKQLAQLGTMIATVSHEIKSPLGIVRSTAEVLKKRIEKVAPGNEQLSQIIVDETNRLNTIVTEFLDFARPQEPKPAPHDLHQIISRAATFVHGLAEQSGVVIKTEFTDGGLIRAVDEDMLYRAFLNITINAIQAMADGGALTITTKVDDDGWAVITIADTGKGMSQEKMDHIFEPFFTDKHKGTGLGLAIAQSSIDSHHGTISVRGGEDGGATFVIRLP